MWWVLTCQGSLAIHSHLGWFAPFSRVGPDTLLQDDNTAGQLSGWGAPKCQLLKVCSLKGLSFFRGRSFNLLPQGMSLMRTFQMENRPWAVPLGMWTLLARLVRSGALPAPRAVSGLPSQLPRWAAQGRVELWVSYSLSYLTFSQTLCMFSMAE